jgi:hypothetical protein
MRQLSQAITAVCEVPDVPRQARKTVDQLVASEARGYAIACDLLVRDVKCAAHPEGFDYLDPIGRAVGLAVYVMREARRLRLLDEYEMGKREAA